MKCPGCGATVEEEKQRREPDGIDGINYCYCANCRTFIMHGNRQRKVTDSPNPHIYQRNVTP